MARPALMELIREKVRGNRVSFWVKNKHTDHGLKPASLNDFGNTYILPFQQAYQDYQTIQNNPMFFYQHAQQQQQTAGSLFAQQLGQATGSSLLNTITTGTSSVI